MPEVTLCHEFSCDEQTFWSRLMFDPEFNQAFYLHVLKFPVYELLEQKVTHSGIRNPELRRRVSVNPPSEMLPESLRDLVGADFRYIEEGVFDRSEGDGVYSFRCVSIAQPERITNVGNIWLEKLGDKKVARVAKVSVTVDIFMIGSFIETAILEDLQRAYDAASAYMQRYIVEKGL